MIVKVITTRHAMSRPIKVRRLPHANIFNKSFII
jgi:hypothetical protein